MIFIKIIKGNLCKAWGTWKFKIEIFIDFYVYLSNLISYLS